MNFNLGKNIPNKSELDKIKYITIVPGSVHYGPEYSFSNGCILENDRPLMHINHIVSANKLSDPEIIKVEIEPGMCLPNSNNKFQQHAAINLTSVLEENNLNSSFIYSGQTNDYDSSVIAMQYNPDFINNATNCSNPDSNVFEYVHLIKGGQDKPTTLKRKNNIPSSDANGNMRFETIISTLVIDKDEVTFSEIYNDNMQSTKASFLAVYKNKELVKQQCVGTEPTNFDITQLYDFIASFQRLNIPEIDGLITDYSLLYEQVEEITGIECNMRAKI